MRTNLQLHNYWLRSIEFNVNSERLVGHHPKNLENIILLIAHISITCTLHKMSIHAVSHGLCAQQNTGKKIYDKHAHCAAILHIHI